MIACATSRIQLVSVVFAASLCADVFMAGAESRVVASKVHPALERMLAEADGPVAAWVFFTDKGVRSKAECTRAIEQVASSYNVRAVRRRTLRRTAPGLFDERDLPVVDAHVDAVARTGARIRVRTRWLNGTSVWATQEQVAAIARLPFVRSLEPVGRTRIPETHAAESSSTGGSSRANLGTFYGRSHDQLSQINLIALHEAGFTGSGIVIGVLDTGFQRTHTAFNHPEHPLHVVAEWDFVNDDPDASIEPGDAPNQHEHGTYILGSLAAYLPGELVGAAYDASYILCKVEDAVNEHNGEEDWFVAGLEFIEANGGDVATSSVVIYVGYGQGDLDGLTSVMTRGINVATENGVHVCQGAGNEGHDDDPTTSHLVPPADAFDAITCGAVVSGGDIADFSSDGPTADGRVKPEVLARGVSVSTVSPYSDDTFTEVSGTSLSTPQVCGAVACLLQAWPEWTVEQMRMFLFRTADYYVVYGTHDPTFVRGYGVVDALAAHSRDCNTNDVDDACDIDCESPGCEPPCGGSLDCNSNGVPDECEPDFDGDGLIDGCDFDRDGDGVVNHRDWCPFTPLGIAVDEDGRPISDTDLNCVVDAGDIWRFVSCFDIGGPSLPIHPQCTDWFDYPDAPGEGPDDDVDLRDCAGFQNAFGRRYESVRETGRSSLTTAHIISYAASGCHP